MKSVYSSHINQIGYNPETNTLSVQWGNGSVTHYGGVPPEVADTVTNAPSIGEALHAHVRGRYEHETVKPE